MLRVSGAREGKVLVMAGLDPAIHDFLWSEKTWMPGTSPGMTMNYNV
jgi:hypothetical protein